MYEVRIDTQKNRLYFHAKGFMQEEEIKSSTHDIVEKAKGLKPGFDAINDISEFRPSTIESGKYIKDAIEKLGEMGLHASVRIVGSILGNMQIKRITTSSHVTYQLYEAQTLKEAENLLESLKN